MPKVDVGFVRACDAADDDDMLRKPRVCIESEGVARRLEKWQRGDSDRRHDLIEDVWGALVVDHTGGGAAAWRRRRCHERGAMPMVVRAGVLNRHDEYPRDCDIGIKIRGYNPKNREGVSVSRMGDVEKEEEETTEMIRMSPSMSDSGARASPPAAILHRRLVSLSCFISRLDIMRSSSYKGVGSTM